MNNLPTGQPAHTGTMDPTFNMLKGIGSQLPKALDIAHLPLWVYIAVGVVCGIFAAWYWYNFLR
jgi:hypothetical protein